MRYISKDKIKDTSVSGFWRIAYVFFICAVLGWIWEEAYCLIKHGFWVERGFLFGPYLPIYGLGGMFIFMLHDRWIKNPSLLFVTSIVVAGVLEYVSSWLLEVVFNEKWWDYTGRWLNLHGRIHLVGLIFFGLAGCGAVYFVLPPLLTLVNKMKSRIAINVCAAVLLVFSVDVAVSVIAHLIK